MHGAYNSLELQSIANMGRELSRALRRIDHDEKTKKRRMASLGIIKDFSDCLCGQRTVEKLHIILARSLYQVTARPLGEDHCICVELHDALEAVHSFP